MNTIIKDALTLFLITLIAGVALGGVHELTLEPIAKAQEEAANTTYREVFPEMASVKETDELNSLVESVQAEAAGWGYGKVSIDNAMEALDASGNKLGYIINASSKEGYGGTISISTGINADGKLTGEWHTEPLTGIEEVPGEEFEMVLQSNWSVTTVGSAYKEGEDDVIDIEVNCPGILWYSIEENTQADLDYYYGGSIQGFAQAIEEDLADYLGTYTMDELLYSGADPMPSIYVYNFDTPTTIYIVEFDENGKATGRYGATAVTIPSGDTGGLAVAKSSVRHPALRHSGLRIGKNLQQSKPEARRPVLGKKVRKAVNPSAPKLVSRSSAAAVKPASKKIGRKAAIVK